MRNLILIGAIVGIVLILRYYLKRSPAQFTRFARQAGLALALVVLLLLLMTGRLNWLLALPAAALVLFNRLGPLLRYIPFLHGLYRQRQSQQSRTSGSQGGQRSSVSARFVHMTLELDTGLMDGEVLEGQHLGKSLSQLSLAELIALLKDWQSDQESVALLRAYLDRNHPDWQAQAGAGESSAGYNKPAKTGMSAEEARQILGVEAGASREEIINAHRRLMQKLHPDRGGSTYLASKVNQAKDVLLDAGQ